MISIFKTDVASKKQKLKVIGYLVTEYPGHRITIDLDDCDKVLRVEGNTFEEKDIITHVNEQGFACMMLLD